MVLTQWGKWFWLFLCIWLCIGNSYKNTYIIQVPKSYFQNTVSSEHSAELQKTAITEPAPKPATCSLQSALWANSQGASDTASVSLLLKKDYSVSHLKGLLFGACRSSCCGYWVQLNLRSQSMVAPQWYWLRMWTMNICHILKQRPELIEVWLCRSFIHSYRMLECITQTSL